MSDHDSTNPHHEPKEPTTDGAGFAADLLRLGLSGRGNGQADSIIGQTFADRFRIVSRLGEGGFGDVYKAEQFEPVKRDVAIKILKGQVRGVEVAARFEGERQALAVMAHPNIAKVFDAGVSEHGQSYFVMEYVSGIPITEYCREHQVDLRGRLAMFQKVCDAVQHAHQRGVIHRDLKPSNILVEEIDGVGVPKVIDFGIAKATTPESGEDLVVTKTESFMGTPAYMSPEQAELGAGAVDTRSDVYSLGVILNELLTGTLPLDLTGKSNHQIRQAIIDSDPVTPSRAIRRAQNKNGDFAATLGGLTRERLGRLLSGDLDAIILHALEKDRDYRYPTPRDFADDIARYVEDRPVEARTVHWGQRLLKLVKRRRQRALAIAAAFGLVITLIAGLVLQGLERERQVGAMLARGNLALERNDLFGALPYYVQALGMDRAGVSEVRTHQFRIGAILGNLPEVTDSWFCGTRVNDIAVHPDGDTVAAACNDGYLRVYSRGRKLPQVEEKLPGDQVFGVAYSPDGESLVAVGTGGFVIVYEGLDFKTPTILAAPTADSLYAVDFVGDGSGLFVGSTQMTGYYWPEWRRQQSVQRVVLQDGGADPIAAVVDCPFDGHPHILACPLGGGVRTVDLNSLEVRSYPVQSEEWKYSADVSPDELLGITGYGDTVLMWDLKTGERLWKSVHNGVRSVALSDNGKWVATGGDDRQVKVWDGDGETLVSPPLPHEGEVDGLAFDPDGIALYSATTSGVIRRWDLSNVRWFPEMTDSRLTADRGFLYRFSTSPQRIDGGNPRWLLVEQGDGILESVNGAESREFDLAGLVERIDVSQDGTRFLALHVPEEDLATLELDWDHFQAKDRSLLSWSVSLHVVQDGRFSELKRVSLGEGDRLLACSEDASLILVGEESKGGSSIRLVDVSGKLDARERSFGELDIRFARFLGAGDSRVLVATSADIYLWDYLSAGVVVVPVENPTEWDDYVVNYVGLSADRRAAVLCTGDGGFTDGYAQVWSLSSGRPLGGQLRHRDGIVHADFSPDGNLLATAGEDNTVKVWKVGLRSVELIREYPHEEDVARVRFSPDGTWLVTVTGDGVMLWDVGRGGPLTPPIKELWGSGIQISDARFIRNGNAVLVERGRGDIAIIELEANPYSLESLQLLSELWSCSRIGDENQVYSLRETEIAERWERAENFRKEDSEVQN